MFFIIIATLHEYFPDISSNYTLIWKNSSRQILDSGIYHLFECKFLNLAVSGSAQTSSGSGGAIFISSSKSLSLLIECSSFSSCFCTNHGGAIYYYNTANDRFTIGKSDANSCYTTAGDWPGGQFFYTKVTKQLTLDQTSISQCSPEAQSTGKWYSIYQIGGNHLNQYINSSNNCLQYTSSFLTYGASSSLMMYNTYSNSISVSYDIYFGTSCTMELSNIVNQTSSTSAVIIANYNCNSIITHSIITNNRNSLVTVSSGSTLTFLYTTISHSTSITTNSLTIDPSCLQTSSVTPIPYNYKEYKCHPNTDMPRIAQKNFLIFLYPSLVY